ncbi:MAG: hypothetical protein Q9M19_04930 [Mariprofundaceae bacterium]|nr:hypothetical protein [Mariprofundaceae bacterium]
MAEPKKQRRRVGTPRKVSKALKESPDQSVRKAAPKRLKDPATGKFLKKTQTIVTRVENGRIVRRAVPKTVGSPVFRNPRRVVRTLAESPVRRRPFRRLVLTRPFRPSREVRARIDLRKIFKRPERVEPMRIFRLFGRKVRISRRVARRFEGAASFVRGVRASLGKEFVRTDPLDFIFRKRGTVNVLKETVRTFQDIKKKPLSPELRRMKLARLTAKGLVVLGGGALVTAIARRFPAEARPRDRSRSTPGSTLVVAGEKLKRAGERVDRALGVKLRPGRPKKFFPKRRRERIAKFFREKVFRMKKVRGLQTSAERSRAAKKGWIVRRRRYGPDGRRD